MKFLLQLDISYFYYQLIFICSFNKAAPNHTVASQAQNKTPVFPKNIHLSLKFPQEEKIKSKNLNYAHIVNCVITWSFFTLNDRHTRFVSHKNITLIWKKIIKKNIVTTF